MPITLIVSSCLLLAGCSSSDRDNQPVDTTPTLNHENYIDVVRHVLGWYSGIEYNDTIVETHLFFYQSDYDTEELISTSPIQWHYEYSCDVMGGTAVADVAFPENTMIIREIDLAFNLCVWNSERYDGASHYTVSSLGNELWQHDGLTVADSDGVTTTVTGTVKESFSGCGYGDYQEWATDSAHYSVGSDATTIELSNVNTLFGYGADCAQNKAVLDGSFTLLSPVTNGLSLDVDIPLAFENTDSADRYFQAGILRIRAEDNSLIEVNAENGDSQSVNVSITIDGATDTFREPWNTWHDSLMLELVKGG